MDMRKVLEDFDAAYNKAFNRGDAAGCAAFFTEDVILLAPDQPMIRGKSAFEELYQSRMDKTSVRWPSCWADRTLCVSYFC